MTITVDLTLINNDIIGNAMFTLMNSSTNPCTW